MNFIDKIVKVFDSSLEINEYQTENMFIGLKIVIVLLVSVWLIVLMLHSVHIYYILHRQTNLVITIEFLYLLFIYINAYIAFSLYELFRSKIIKNKETNKDNYASYLEKLRNYTEENKVYLDPDITITEICEKLDIPVQQMSKALNHKLHKNFYFFINEYRVEEAKRLLSDISNDSKSVITIGFESGFNSKSTFNDIFKKMTGMTPTEFRKLPRN